MNLSCNRAIRHVNLAVNSEKHKLTTFLGKVGLTFDEDTEFSVVVETGNDILATASFSGKIIKQVAVKDDMRGKGLLQKLITEVIQEMNSRGISHALVYTRSENADYFKSLGFNTVVNIIPYIAFLEWGTESISQYTALLKNTIKSSDKVKHNTAFLVSSEESFHTHLTFIAKVARQSEWGYIFVVHDARSPLQTRKMVAMIQDGISHINNLHVFDGKEYVFPNSFPAYFSKGKERSHLWALVDAELFGKYVAPTLQIRSLYIVDSTFNNRPSDYNEIVRKRLVHWNIEILDV